MSDINLDWFEFNDWCYLKSYRILMYVISKIKIKTQYIHNNYSFTH